MTTLNHLGESLYLFCFIEEGVRVEIVDLKVETTVKYFRLPIHFEFKKIPEPLVGNMFCQDEGIQYHQPRFPFTVSSVRGHVKWHHTSQHPGSNFLPVLRLKRVRSRKTVGKLTLAQFESGQSMVKFTKQPESGNKDLFWQLGRAGSICL